jgi:alkylated DNA repair dioxygenase AlkB
MSDVLQSALFDAPPQFGIQGLTYVSDALSAREERALINEVETVDFKPFAFRGFVGNRRTVSYGWRYDFSGGGFQQAEPLPDFLLPARAIAGAHAGLDPNLLVQASIIEYAPGAGIGWHRDRPHFGQVLGFSLTSPCRFRFRRERPGGGWERHAVTLEPRSLYVLDGEARASWQHSIPVLDQTRYSVSFRTLSALGESLVKR